MKKVSFHSCLPSSLLVHSFAHIGYDEVMKHTASPERYSDSSLYRRCGKSGLLLPKLSLGMWHNFGDLTDFETQKQILRTAFDHGITHFDLANNYGPPYGEAERNFGLHFENDWKPYRDELIISSKAGWDMWPGPYGDLGSRKYLIASLDQSLKRMHLDYVDIFYHHRPDFDTPLEETMGALDQIVRSGKALYIGLSNYPADRMEEACKILKSIGTPCLVNQNSYSILNRTVEEDGLLDNCEKLGSGMVAYAPLSSGLLSDKYLRGIPEDSRAAREPMFIRERITPDMVKELSRLNEIAKRRGQTLAQMALQWVLKDGRVTSAIIGASRPQQVLENLKALSYPELSAQEIAEIG